MVFFNNVSKIYPAHLTRKQQVVLKDVSFKVEKGEFVSLVGKSGAGKTTIFKILVAEEKPTQGRVFLGEQDVHKINPSQLFQLRRKIGTVFQDYKLLSSKTVYENVGYIMEVMGKSDEEIRKDVPEILEIVGLLHRAYHFPRELSGGEMQRAAIARAFVGRPDVILADEPTGNLDPYHTLDVLNLLLKINELGTTVILATHDKDIINNLSKRVISLEDGKITSDELQGRFRI